MKPARQTLAEQETVIRWDREESGVHIFSANPVVWRKLERLGLEPVRRSTVAGEEAGRFYVVPVGRLRWGLKPEGGSRRRGNPAALLAARARRAGRPVEEAGSL
jgi:hypothetical protein